MSKRDLEWLKSQSGNLGSLEWGLNYGPVKDSPLNYYTLHVISQMLNENPLIGQLVEIGQFTGTISLYLGMEAVARGLDCHSYEILKQTDVPTDRVLTRLGVHTHYCDVFQYPEMVIDIINKKPTLIFVDGGNKALEFEVFVPHLPQHSIIIVHDFMREVVDSFWHVHADKVLPINIQNWSYLNCQTACFKVK